MKDDLGKWSFGIIATAGGIVGASITAEGALKIVSLCAGLVLTCLMIVSVGYSVLIKRERYRKERRIRVTYSEETDEPTTTT